MRRSSGRAHLAKVEVEGSNPFARSKTQTFSTLLSFLFSLKLNIFLNDCDRIVTAFLQTYNNLNPTPINLKTHYIHKYETNILDSNLIGVFNKFI